MTTNKGSSNLTVTLDDLIALNDEILALARSGVPLQRGLLDLGHDLSGQLGKITTMLGQEMESGKSLPEALRSHGDQIPSVYRAVVEAGIGAGRLPAALEGLARTSRRVAELRRVIGMALLYPLLLLTVVCLLLAFVVPATVRAVSTSAHVQRVDEFLGAKPLVSLMDSAHLWLWAVPVGVIAMALGWWFRAGRAVAAGSNRRSYLARQIPWLGKLIYSVRVATFCELLGLLVKHQVPLAESVILAADASGDWQIRVEADDLAQRIRRGQQPESPARCPRAAIPPLLAWTLASDRPAVDLPAALSYAADTYYRRAEHLSDWTQLYLPIILTLGIGGTATILYGVLVMGPWFHFLYQLATAW